MEVYHSIEVIYSLRKLYLEQEKYLKDLKEQIEIRDSRVKDVNFYLTKRDYRFRPLMKVEVTEKKKATSFLHQKSKETSNKNFGEVCITDGEIYYYGDKNYDIRSNEKFEKKFKAIMESDFAQKFFLERTKLRNFWCERMALKIQPEGMKLVFESFDGKSEIIYHPKQDEILFRILEIEAKSASKIKNHLSHYLLDYALNFEIEKDSFPTYCREQIRKRWEEYRDFFVENSSDLETTYKVEKINSSIILEKVKKNKAK